MTTKPLPTLPEAGQCPSCGSAIVPGGRFCVACGRPAPEFAPVERPAAAAGQSVDATPGRHPSVTPVRPSSQPYAARPLSGLSRPAESDRPLPIPNYLVWAVLSAICFIFTGIIAIFYAIQGKRKLDQGDIEAAQSCSHNAKTWCWFSFWLGAATYILSGLAYLVYLVIRAISSVELGP